MHRLLFLIALIFSTNSTLAGSTVNPNVPATGSELVSAVVRGNFAAAYSDINNLLGAYPGASAPINPVVGQFWRKTNVSPQQIYQWSGTAWLPYSTFDVSGGGVTPAFGNSLLAWQQLMTGAGGLGSSGQCVVSTGVSAVPTMQDCVTSLSMSVSPPLAWDAPTKTMSLNYGSDLTLSGSSLVLSSIIAGQTQGSGTSAPVVTVDAKGRVTALTSTQITPPFTAVTGQASLSQLPQLPPNTVIGNATGDTANSAAITQTQLTALVNTATSAASGAVPAWPGDATQFFDGTGNYAAVPFTSITGSLSCGQMPALTGDVTTSAGACGTSIGAGKVTNAMLAGSIAASKLIGTDIATVGTIASGTWQATPVAVAYGGTGATTAANARTNLGVAIGSNVQAWDTDLDCLAALSTSGIVARTGAGTCATRTVTAPAAGITVSNGDGVSGNPTLALANDLAALEALTGTGFAVRTGMDAWTQRSIGGTTNEITVSNGDGVSGNPTLSLPSALTLTGKTVTGGTFGAPQINSPTGIVKGDVGLGNVDNTSDANKPVSTAQQTALNLKADKATTLTAGTGLTGGGDLSANRTIALSTGSITSLGKADTALQSVVAGINVTVDNTDPRNPIVNASGGGGGSSDPWAAQPIGVPIPLLDNIVGVAQPPTNQSYRYIKLTASDSYNTDVLTSESITGSAPLVVATAVISLTGSPLNGQTVNLINTERRVLRAGSAGTVENDQMQQITGSLAVNLHASPTAPFFTDYSGALSVGASRNSNSASNAGGGTLADGVTFNSANSPGARAGTETRGKNIGVTYFMRIK